MFFAPPSSDRDDRRPIARRVCFGGVQEILRIVDDFSKSELLSPVMAALYSGADWKFEWIVLLHQEEGK